jgi:anti-sigma B factor antagonist
MDITTTKRGNVSVISVVGRFDAYNATDFKSALQSALTQTRNVIVNMADISFMDSTALATLVQGMKHCRQQGGDLRLCSPQEAVRIIFELTRLDKAFSMYDAETTAVASFRS